MATMTHRRLALLVLLSFLVFTFASAVALEAEDFRISRRTSNDDGKKTDDRCSYTSQCPTCTSVDSPGAVQCCWPYGKGYGSPFDAPGFCICAPSRLYDYSQCNGGFWTS